jgi:hypothetical protein
MYSLIKSILTLLPFRELTQNKVIMITIRVTVQLSQHDKFTISAFIIEIVIIF